MSDLITRGDVRRLSADRRVDFGHWVRTLGGNPAGPLTRYAIYRTDDGLELQLTELVQGAEPTTLTLPITSEDTIPAWLRPAPPVFIDGLTRGGAQ